MLGEKLLHLALFLVLLSEASEASEARGSRISISPDGGYNDIVIKIKMSVPEERCQQILVGIKVRSAQKGFRLSSLFIF